VVRLDLFHGDTAFRGLVFDGFEDDFDSLFQEFLSRARDGRRRRQVPPLV
jgi:hypothetical protein